MPTIGVSVPVPDPWGRELQDYRIDLGDEAAQHIPTHITLLPPFVVDEASLDDVVTHLEGVASRVPPFHVHLRGTGTFRPVSPVVFVGVVEGISGCELLAARVQSGPLAIERVFPYHPHVTVAHHLEQASLDRAFEDLGDFEASFDVTAMWMYLHDDESGWQPSHAFDLRGQVPATPAPTPATHRA